MGGRGSAGGKGAGSIALLQSKIERNDAKLKKLSEENTKIYKAIGADYEHKDTRWEKWYANKDKINKLNAEISKYSRQIGELRSKQEAKNPQRKTFVNSFGEAGTRYITSLTYERAQRRMEKQLLGWMSGKK